MKHFKITEFIKCYRERKSDRCSECRLTAAAHSLPAGVEANIEALVEQVLDPAREKYGKPIYVSSGFRCPLHNTTVGGVPRSQHIQGEAADIHCEDNKALLKILVDEGRYDQIIIYPTFLHVSWKRMGTNRKRILRKTSTGYAVVLRTEI